MRDDEFEWETGKLHATSATSGITFEKARAAFHDPQSINRRGLKTQDEERFSRLCRHGYRVFVVVWTERGNRIRIISARAANKHEQQIYFRQ